MTTYKLTVKAEGNAKQRNENESTREGRSVCVQKGTGQIFHHDLSLGVPGGKKIQKEEMLREIKY